MSIWPWRSRPVVTPFDSNYSGHIWTDPSTYTSSPISVKLPSNFYITPTSLSLTFSTASGIRNTNPSHLLFVRGGIPFATANFGNLVDSKSLTWYFSSYGDTGPAAQPDLSKLALLPSPLYLYPDDQLLITVPSMISGDSLTLITIHGRFWEII